MYIYCIYIVVKEKIQFGNFIINLFRVYGDPLQMEKGIQLYIWIWFWQVYIASCEKRIFLKI